MTTTQWPHNQTLGFTCSGYPVPDLPVGSGGDNIHSNRLIQLNFQYIKSAINGLYDYNFSHDSDNTLRIQIIVNILGIILRPL